MSLTSAATLDAWAHDGHTLGHPHKRSCYCKAVAGMWRRARQGYGGMVVFAVGQRDCLPGAGLGQWGVGEEEDTSGQGETWAHFCGCCRLLVGQPLMGLTGRFHLVTLCGANCPMWQIQWFTMGV
jgi:hypothetical protein